MRQRFIFLSTLSLRRATAPQPPPGQEFYISIHALLAESDIKCAICRIKVCIFLSTLSLRRATNRRTIFFEQAGYFYPRSPCGERRSRFLFRLLVQNYFYPRSPCGERPIEFELDFINQEFLSTLSLRRATGYVRYCIHARAISIHALLAESDNRRTDNIKRNKISIHALLAESDQIAHQ